MSRRPSRHRCHPDPDYYAPADAPYTGEEILVKAPGSFTLAGTLTLPKDASTSKAVAAIITITGSGQEDRDSWIGSGVPAFSSDSSSWQDGIATLRMDDRGTGASGGTFKGSTTADFGEDARAGLAYCGRGLKYVPTAFRVSATARERDHADGRRKRVKIKSDRSARGRR